jgi:hypothetical protein
MDNERRLAQRAKANRKWRTKNKDHSRTLNKAWALAHPERKAAAQRKMRYGLTAEAFQAMLKKQEGKCAICGSANKTSQGGKLRQLAVDHDEARQLVRGLLCHHCNLGIGHLLHDPNLLRKAIAYLETYS